jgi:hypothetical protein
VADAQIGCGLNPFGAGTAGVVISDPFLTGSMGHGVVDLRIGAGSAGPLSASSATFVDSLAVLVGDAFGYAAFGSGFSGKGLTTDRFSFIGSDLTAPDLVVIPYKENNQAASVYILDGSSLVAAGTAVDVVGSSNVRVALPSDWFGVSAYSGPAKDINGDGYGDLVIGELDTAVVPSIKGRAIVLW